MFGNYSVISFNGKKIITGSSGGMLLTEDTEAANKARKWSTQSRENAAWYQHEEMGFNYRMSNIIAGVVRGQIPYLETHIAQKKAIYERYKEGLKDLPVKMNPFDTVNSVPKDYFYEDIVEGHYNTSRIWKTKYSEYLEYVLSIEKHTPKQREVEVYDSVGGGEEEE